MLVSVIATDQDSNLYWRQEAVCRMCGYVVPRGCLPIVIRTELLNALWVDIVRSLAAGLAVFYHDLGFAEHEVKGGEPTFLFIVFSVIVQIIFIHIDLCRNELSIQCCARFAKSTRNELGLMFVVWLFCILPSASFGVTCSGMFSSGCSRNLTQNWLCQIVLGPFDAAKFLVVIHFLSTSKRQFYEVYLNIRVGSTAPIFTVHRLRPIEVSTCFLGCCEIFWFRWWLPIHCATRT